MDPKTIYRHYRYTHQNGDAKDWLIAEVNTTVEIWFGKRNNTLQLRTIPASDPKVESFKRENAKKSEGYVFLGDATIKNRRAVPRLAPQVTVAAPKDDPHTWYYEIRYRDGLPLELAPDIVEQFQKAGLRLFDKGNHVALGEVKIYKAVPRKQAEFTGQLHLPDDVDGALLLLALQKHAKVVEIVNGDQKNITGWQALNAYRQHLTPAHESAAELVKLKLIGLDKSQDAQSMYF